MRLMATPKQHLLRIALMAVIKTGTCPRIVDWSSYEAAFIHAFMKMQFQWAPLPSYDAAKLRCPVVRTSGLWQRLLACSNWATGLNSLGKCQFRMVLNSHCCCKCKKHENSIRLFFGLVLLASWSQRIPSEHHRVLVHPGDPSLQKWRSDKTTQWTTRRMMSYIIIYHYITSVRPHSFPKKILHLNSCRFCHGLLIIPKDLPNRVRFALGLTSTGSPW